MGNSLPSSVAEMAAPVRDTIASARNLRSGPVRVISRPSFPRVLPTSALAIWKDIGSIGPPCPKPLPMVGRPGKSSTRVYEPPARTSIAGGRNTKVERNCVIVFPASNSGDWRIARRKSRFVGGPHMDDFESTVLSSLTASDLLWPCWRTFANKGSGTNC